MKAKEKDEKEDDVVRGWEWGRVDGERDGRVWDVERQKDAWREGVQCNA